MCVMEIQDYVLDPNATEKELQDLHVYPAQDLRPHVISKKCWCKPELMVDDMHGRIYKHNSMDGREDYETGKRKLN